MSIQFHLASKSPRRQELLRQVGFVFDVRGADIVEQPQPNEAPADYARRMALEKARAVQSLLSAPSPCPPPARGGGNIHEGSPARAGKENLLPVLGADTDVVLDGRILGKPRDREDAIRMLCALSGREHEVVSAVALVQGARSEVALSVTRVCFGVITPQAAADYWATGEPADKAGAYGIQGIGAQFVREIHGSYSGVVGLPLHETCQLLLQFGILPPS